MSKTNFPDIKMHSKNRIALTREDKVLNALIMVIMMLVFIFTVYPFYYVLVMSFNDGYDAMAGGIYLWPRKFSFENYSEFLTDQKWITAIFISVSRTLVGT
ncbi:MAG: hypothetical protein GX933_05750, partial [Chloroflexi bacterium]|nr:hypothetical protein [Chloroflexota bacterium]